MVSWVCGLFAENICKSILNVCYENCLPKVYRIVTSRIQFSPTLECYAFVSVSRCLALQYRAWLTGRGSINFSESFSVSIFWINIRLWPITRLKSLPLLLLVCIQRDRGIPIATSDKRFSQPFQSHQHASYQNASTTIQNPGCCRVREGTSVGNESFQKGKSLKIWNNCDIRLMGHRWFS